MQFTFFLVSRSLRALRLLIPVGLLLLITGCQSVSYLWQAAKGQWEIIHLREPVSELLDDAATPQPLQDKLRYVNQVREFAQNQLALPVGDAYSSYADLGRPYVVWNLFVAPELSLDAESWCYPVAGCVTYQGYFSREDAEQAARQWQQQGYDTYIGGVSAYSTLGWLDDPLLNTFMDYDRISLAALLFHELAHRQLYIKGDTRFNESWATAVEQTAIKLFIADNGVIGSNGSDSGDNRYNEQVDSYLQHFQDRNRFAAMVKMTVDSLREIYASDLDDAAKRKAKALAMDELRERYQSAVSAGEIGSQYANWLKPPLNNAKLLTVSSYYHWVPGLQYQLATLGNDFSAFYSWSEQFEGMQPEEREALLRQLNTQAYAASRLGD